MTRARSPLALTLFAAALCASFAGRQPAQAACLDTPNQDPSAHEALAAAHGEMRRLAPGQDIDSLELQLATNDLGAAGTTAVSYHDSVQRLDQLVAHAAPDTRVWACLLATRGELEDGIDRPDLAVTDELRAYRSAQAHQWPDTAAFAAFTLAGTYRRGGLWSDADRMVQESLSYALQQGLPGARIDAQILKGHILAEQGHWHEAYSAFASARQLALGAGKSLSATLATVPMCAALLDGGQSALAKSLCPAPLGDAAKLGGAALDAAALIVRARIDAADRHYASALTTLNQVVEQRVGDLSIRQQAGLFRARAETLSALGQDHAAVADWTRALAAADADSKDERLRSVAVLRAIAKLDALESANRELARENLSQRKALEDDLIQRRLTVALAVAGILVSCLLAVLLYMGGRHRRALGRQALMLSTLTDNLSDTLMLLDPELRVRFANRALPGSTAWTEGSMLLEGRRLRELTPPDVYEAFASATERVIRDRVAVDFETRRRDADGRVRHFEQRAIPVMSGDRLSGVTLRSTDVTARWAMQETVLQQARVLDTMSEGVIVLDADGRITYANAAIYEMLATARGSLLSRPAESLCPLPANQQPWARLLESPDAAQATEIVLGRGDGTEILASLAASRLQLADRTALICVLRDISGTRRAERAVAGATGLDALRVGSSLHEGLAQELTGVSLLLANITKRLPDGDAAETAAIVQYLSDAIRSARELAQRLSPIAAVRGSLSSALPVLCAETAERLEIPVRWQGTVGEQHIDGIMADQVYRIAVDMLRYATRHADCEQVDVEFHTDSASLNLSVHWTGSGYRTEATSWSGGEAEVIRHRARLLGGECRHEASVTGTPGVSSEESLLFTAPLPANSELTAQKRR
jgi:PAS domain S-box-containing protein